MIKKLAEIANELDDAGYTELADKIDSVVDLISKQAAPTVLLPADVRSPEWMAEAAKALPLLMKGWGMIDDKSPPANRVPEKELSVAISKIQSIYKANLAKQSGQIK